MNINNHFFHPLYPLTSCFCETKEWLAHWENFLNDSELNYLLNLPEWKTSSSAMIGDDALAPIKNEEVRRSNVAWIRPTEQNREIYDKLGDVISHVNKEFFGFELNGMYEPAQLTMYRSDNQEHYNWHTDAGYMKQSGPRSYRKLSMSLLLSDPDDFEGGDLQLNIGGEPITLEQKQGRAWFFPSYAVHRVTPVTRGVRRSLVVWVAGPAFR